MTRRGWIDRRINAQRPADTPADIARRIAFAEVAGQVNREREARPRIETFDQVAGELKWQADRITVLMAAKGYGPGQ